MEEFGRIIGQLHNVGKYSDKFQKRLEGGPKVDHATAGAQLVNKKYGNLGLLLSFCIAGHHTGLSNWIRVGKKSGLQYRLFHKKIKDYSIYKDFITLPDKIPDLKLETNRKEFEITVLVRMLFSCLIDADRTDTKKFYKKFDQNKAYSKLDTVEDWPQLLDMKKKFDMYMREFGDDVKTKNHKTDPKINKIRHDILEISKEKGKLKRGIFTFTVPTGGGKTLSSLAFALEHALCHKLDRIIYVVPYMSITHQNAEVFRKAVGDNAVLEHHSSFKIPDSMTIENSDKLKIAEEDWSAPLIVTTAVQFFESLFSNKPTRCKKLHNIANSVVILDEAQSLPLALLIPCVAMLDTLAKRFGVTIVLCTATQPALLEKDGFPNGFDLTCEISENVNEIYKLMRRTVIKPIGEKDDNYIANDILKKYEENNYSVLCIVNTRKHATVLYQLLEEHDTLLFHLSALMCPEHRKEKIEKISKTLKSKIPCIVISTSLIEAGVDLDFNVVYREMTGLDSIAQAAGRCNREGKKDLGDVYVFNSPDTYQPAELQRSIAISNELIDEESDDLLSSNVILKYFQKLYWITPDNLDGKEIMKKINIKKNEYELAFDDIAKDFKMIDDSQESIIIPYNDEAKKHIQILTDSEYPNKSSRYLQPYVVQIKKKEFEKLCQASDIKQIAPEKFSDQFWVLDNDELYDEFIGLGKIKMS